MNFNKIISLFFVLSSNLLFAQISTNTNLYELVDPDHLNTDLIYEGEGKNYKGTPFYDKNWNNGYVITNDGTKHENIQLKLDIYKNDLALKKEDGSIIILDKKQVDTFGWKSEGNIVFEKRKLKKKSTYLEVVFKGETTNVYRENIKDFIKVDAQNSNSYSSDQKDEYKLVSKKLYLEKENKLIEISSKGKEFFNCFGEYKSTMVSFAKKNKLKTKKKEDIEQLFAHYESLLLK
ncbi:hypothetical protein MY04_1372 [Flammeovirga sp. MY04]|uniref:hypothetical protein n=1 Tax=Flammeovirga sp. MY04 TaxID=1191459 RepID=UPI000825EA5F|nr:hypothetical protein [Flammeovirga sp. MY04]ANQ48748.2 hypothetical protein MY04_1372 [Flammeovirga sp. MY04]